MKHIITYISFLLSLLSGMACAVDYLFEDKEQRFYQQNNFILAEQCYLVDECAHPHNLPDVEQKSRTHVKEKLLYDSENTLLQADNQIFVMDHEGTIYTAPNIPHHSYFLKSFPDDSTYGFGRDIACAGHLTAVNGKITAIINASGHYLPSDDQLKLAVKFLHDKGVLAPDVKILWARSLGGPVSLFLDIIFQEDTKSILSRYPRIEKTWDKNYINQRMETAKKLKTNVDEFRDKCPKAMLNQPISNFLPNFRYFPEGSSVPMGVVNLEGRNWQILVKNSWVNPRVEIINAPASAFVFQDIFNSTILLEEEIGGVTAWRGACVYSIIYPPIPENNMFLYLLPLVK